MNVAPVLILDEVSQTGIDLLLREPYYAHFLINLNKRVDTTTVDTLAVGAEGNHFVLYINPAFWNETLTRREHRYGVLKHEVLHLLFRHVTRSRDFANKQIYNIAADILVNQYIAPEQLPEGAVRLNGFSELSLKPEQTVDYYYQQLIELWRLQNQPDQYQGAYQYLRELLEQESGELKRHALWEQIAEGSTADQQLLDVQLATLVQIADQRTGNKSRGNLPAGIQQQLAAFNKRHIPQVNWRRTLRQFTASSSRTCLKNSLKKPSKRYGTSPGIKIRRRQKIMVVLDTSGSIAVHELELFFSEVYHLWKQGAQIQVVECDAAIGNVYPYQGKTPPVISGGGGTCFTAPVVYANEKFFPDAIIYFTDGYGRSPVVPSRTPILWLISGRGLQPEDKQWNDLPGQKIKMTE